MLFGNADIKGAFGKFIQNLVNARAVRHRGGQRNDLFIVRHQFAHRFAENRSVSRNTRTAAFDRLSGFYIERSGRVISVIIFFGIRKAFAFRRQSVNDDRTVINFFRFFERTNEHRDIMTVNITDIFKTEFVDERAGKNRRRNRVFE